MLPAKWRLKPLEHVQAEILRLYTDFIWQGQKQ